MFKKLQSKWKVSIGRLLLIIITFALGGSLCGLAGRKLMLFTGLEKGVVWVFCYIILITLLWPLCVLVVSIPLGQYSFFKNYLQRIFSKLKKRIANDDKKTGTEKVNIAIFASGAGSNAEVIIKSLPKILKNTSVSISVIITNNSKAGVANIALSNNIPLEMLHFNNLNEEQIAAAYLSALNKYQINFIVLAGYLKKIPKELIRAYPQKIVNIHPALLPAYGGKGMYGMQVHDAVVAAQEKRSGITIQYVDEVYDHGKIIFQEECDLEPGETGASLAKKIHALEHAHYSKIIAEVIVSQFPVK